MTATLEDKEAWEAQYKLNEAARLFPHVIELVNEAKVHYEHIDNTDMAYECYILQENSTYLTDKFGKATRRSWRY